MSEEKLTKQYPEDLKQVFLSVGVPKEDIDAIIDALGIDNRDDLKYFREAKDYAEAGVKSKLSQKKLEKYAQDLAERLADEGAPEESEKEDNSLATADLLIKIPEDEELLAALQTEGILQFSREMYIFAIKFVLASRAGIYNKVEALYNMIRDYVTENSKPAPEFWYDLQKILTYRNYGAVFAALEERQINGVPIYASNADTEQLRADVATYFVPAILKANAALCEWNDNLNLQAQSGFFLSQTAADLKPNVSADTSAILDASTNLRLAINRTFAGNGIQKVLAAYHETKAFMDVMKNPDLPASVGCVDRDAVLARLGFDINAAAVRSEGFIVQFIINMVDAPEKSGLDETKFFMQLYELSQKIDWGALVDGDISEYCTTNGYHENSAQVALLKGASAPAIGTTPQPSMAIPDKQATGEEVRRINGRKIYTVEDAGKE